MSLALDLWSNRNRDSIIAITGHYIAQRTNTAALELRSFLLDFSFFDGSHSGVNIADKVFGVLKTAGLLKSVCNLMTPMTCYSISQQLFAITMDNASNNNTFMAEFARLLHDADFDATNNRIRSDCSISIIYPI